MRAKGGGGAGLVGNQSVSQSCAKGLTTYMLHTILDDSVRGTPKDKLLRIRGRSVLTNFIHVILEIDDDFEATFIVKKNNKKKKMKKTRSKVLSCVIKCNILNIILCTT